MRRVGVLKNIKKVIETFLMRRDASGDREPESGKQAAGRQRYRESESGIPIGR